MDAATFVRTYYDALRAGDPLAPFFADGPQVVKVGISERLVGGDAVAAGLREQTATTADWTVDSRDLRVVEDGDWACFADEVGMAWTGEDGHHEFDSRWSGTLHREEDWTFVGMHVSAPTPL